MPGSLYKLITKTTKLIVQKTKLIAKDTKLITQKTELIIKKTKLIAEKTDRFTIQITSKRILKEAQKFSQDLINKGYDVYIQKVELKNNEIWYRVRIGSYDSYNLAKKASKMLTKNLGYETWVDFIRKEQN